MCTRFRILLVMALALVLTGCRSGSESENERSLPILDFETVITEAGNRVFPALVFLHVVRDNLESGRAEGNVVCGSGVLISPDGELLTNWHVVDKAQTVRCLLNDGRAYSAKVVGTDKDIDLALLKLELPETAGPLPVAALAPVDFTVREGDFVMAMGAPWGLSRSVSLGILSCSNRFLPEQGRYSLWYQTDASISPGNSGGPLVNTNGQVIGINTLGVMMGGTTGFAIPVDTIRDVLPRLREYGGVNWAWFGLQLQPLFDFERNIRFEFSDGVIVSGTDPGSPARRAGFLPNDRIVAIDGSPVTVRSAEALPAVYRKLGLRPFEQPVTFSVVRAGKPLSLTAAPIPKGKVEGEELSLPRWGFTAKAINRFDTPQLHFYRPEGLYIYGISPRGNAADSELRPGDILVSVDGAPVITPMELETIYQKRVADVENNPRALMTVLRNGRSIQTVLDFYNQPENEEE